MKKYIFSIACLLLIASITSAHWAIGQSDENRRELTPHQQLARDIFRELIEINTTANSGSTKAAEAMAARLKKAGFPENDVQVIGPQPNHLNLVARYRGKGLRPPILFICHLDVVEALRQDWSFDPFLFRESDGYFYGRGASDVKHENADLIAGLIRLRQEEFVPNRDIIVALTEGEETGDNNGIQWLLANHRDLIEAEYCINPDGGAGEIKNGIPSILQVQTSEKIYLDYSFEVKNNGGHSSVPVKENAIYRLAGALTRLSNFEFPAMLNETTKMFFERSALQEAGQVKADMLAMMKSPLDMAAVNRLAESSPFYNAMMRTTCVATMLNAGHANNALPQTARAIVNCRMLPDDTPDNVSSTLKSTIADPFVKITCEYASTLSPRSPLRKDVLDSIEQVTASMWSGAIVIPVMSTGATDGRLLRATGIPTYGVSGMFFETGDHREHGKDERIGVKEFYNGIEFMYRLIKTLASES